LEYRRSGTLIFHPRRCWTGRLRSHTARLAAVGLSPSCGGTPKTRDYGAVRRLQTAPHRYAAPPPARAPVMRKWGDRFAPYTTNAAPTPSLLRVRVAQCLLKARMSSSGLDIELDDTRPEVNEEQFPCLHDLFRFEIMRQAVQHDIQASARIRHVHRIHMTQRLILAQHPGRHAGGTQAFTSTLCASRRCLRNRV
jgi:hypothetical protein